MRRLALIGALVAAMGSGAGAQPDGDPRARWAQYLRDSMPGSRDALWEFEVVSESLTRLQLEEESGGRVRLTINVRLGEKPCIDPTRDFENPPNLGTATIRGVSVGYRATTVTSSATFDACAKLASGRPSRYLRVTGLFDPRSQRQLVESSLSAIIEAVREAPALVERVQSAPPIATKPTSQGSTEERLRVLLGLPKGFQLDQEHIDKANREAKKKPEVVDEQELGGAIFASVGWQFWLDNPSGVPKAEDEDAALGIAGLGQAFNLNVGALRGNYFGAFGAQLYRGEIREGTTPGVFQLVAGLGGAGRSWSKGGISQVKSYSYERLTQFGLPCPKYDKDEDPILREAKFRGVKCNQVRVTEHTTNFDIPPGWVIRWTGVYGGWRHANDMLGGAKGDADRPIGSSSGPIIGAMGFVRRGPWALEMSHELGYYLVGIDGATGPSYNGRVGFGSLLALMDLRWRLDSATGKEFMVGIQFRTDFFDGIRFWES